MPRAGLAEGEPPAWLLLAMDRQLRAREQRALAAYLHNGAMQEIFAASLELQLLHRSHLALPPGIFDGAIQRLDAAAAALDRLPGGFPVRPVRWPVSSSGGRPGCSPGR